ncbi:MAG: hypothetical protein QOI55_2751, partial [Actinomycetota bacterium]|nr:hypothetical protein [Actinomycetota bacterium]
MTLERLFHAARPRRARAFLVVALLVMAAFGLPGRAFASAAADYGYP